MSYSPASGTGASPSAEPRFDLRDFLAFRYLITPGLVTIIYAIGAIFITLAALLLPASANQGAGGILAGLLILVFGNLYWRVILEFVMVLFRINDSLASIDRRGRGM
jgi:hypothetical protein